MSKSEVIWQGIPTSNVEHMKAIKDAIDCAYDSYGTIATAKDELKDIFDDVHEKTGIPKRVFNFLAKSNYTGRGREIVDKNSELADALDAFDNM